MRNCVYPQLNYGESLRWYRACLGGQQNPAPCRCSNQRETCSGAYTFTRQHSCRPQISSSPWFVSQPVNMMSESTTARLWDTGQESCPSQYTRMIPGTSAMPRPRFAPKAANSKHAAATAIHVSGEDRIRALNSLQRPPQAT